MEYWCDECELSSSEPVCAHCGASLTEEARGPLPWSWRFFIVATIIYVIWRIYQLVSWLAH